MAITQLYHSWALTRWYRWVDGTPTIFGVGWANPQFYKNQPYLIHRDYLLTGYCTTFVTIFMRIIWFHILNRFYADLSK